MIKINLKLFSASPPNPPYKDSYTCLKILSPLDYDDAQHGKSPVIIRTQFIDIKPCRDGNSFIRVLYFQVVLCLPAHIIYRCVRYSMTPRENLKTATVM